MTNMQGGMPPGTWKSALDVVSLAGVVYSSGKVFDGLRTGRLDTENFLRSGSLDGITSRSDLALLEDLRDVAQFVIDHRDTPIDATYVRDVNAQITRSGPLHPGRLRTQDQQIGVSTPHGRHEPKPLNDGGLQQIIDQAMGAQSPREQALELFVQIAKAQPFEDGNKRTALFVANSLLIRQPEPETLVIPTDDAELPARFNELLARAYVFDEHDGVKDLLRAHGFSKQAPKPAHNPASHLERNPELRGVQLDPYGLAAGAPEQESGPQLG